MGVGLYPLVVLKFMIFKYKHSPFYHFQDRKTESDFKKSHLKTLSFMMNGSGLWILQHLQSVKNGNRERAGIPPI